MKIVARANKEIARTIECQGLNDSVRDGDIRLGRIGVARVRCAHDRRHLIAHEAQKVQIEIETIRSTPGHDERAARLEDENRRRRRLLRQ